MKIGKITFMSEVHRLQTRYIQVDGGAEIALRPAWQTEAIPY